MEKDNRKPMVGSSYLGCNQEGSARCDRLAQLLHILLISLSCLCSIAHLEQKHTLQPSVAEDGERKYPWVKIVGVLFYSGWITADLKEPVNMATADFIPQ